MVLAEQFLPRIFGYCTELVVHVRDLSPGIRDGHDRVFVESIIKVAQVADRGAELFFHRDAFTGTFVEEEEREEQQGEAQECAEGQNEKGRGRLRFGVQLVRLQESILLGLHTAQDGTEIVLQ